MTREEAIDVLKRTIAYESDFAEAIDMAREALSSEQNRPIKVRNDGTLFVKVLDVSKVERVIIGDDKSAFRQDFSKPFSNNITDSQNDVIETKNDVIEPKLYTHEEVWSDDDLISRADAIRAVAEHFSFDDGCSNIYKDIDYYKGIAEHILKNVPSALPLADAAEVVRCKDCRHGQYDATHYFCAEHYHKVYEDDYCSHGERQCNYFGERREE